MSFLKIHGRGTEELVCGGTEAFESVVEHGHSVARE